MSNSGALLYFLSVGEGIGVYREETVNGDYAGAGRGHTTVLGRGGDSGWRHSAIEM